MTPVNLQAYRWVLLVHSDWRWMVLVAGFATVFSAAVRLTERSPWEPPGPRLGRLFSIAIDIQVLLGFALYLLFSPLTTVVLSSTAHRLPPQSDAHFIAVVHPMIMLGAFVAVHVSSVLVRRGRSDGARQRRALVCYGATLLILLGGIPWWRPWLRL